MEFAVPLPADVIAVPAGHEYTGTAPDGSPGKQWISEYDMAGANALGEPHIIDGINTEGLTVGLFYFAHYVGYEEPQTYDNALAPWEFTTWMLSTCATVQDVRESLDQVDVCAVSEADFGTIVGEADFIPPAHYLVMDAAGDCIVIEHIEGRPMVYDNPLGVITNDPAFDWHLTNLNNYVNLSPVNAEPFEMEGMTISPLGLGSGLLGIPGDFTPPSRFVQAAFFSWATPAAQSAREAVLQTFHLLNQFDIPLGASQRRGADQEGNPIFDTTLWSTVSDLSNCRYYFRTYKNSRIKMLDLNTVDFRGDRVVSYPMCSSTEEIADITTELDPGTDS